MCARPVPVGRFCEFLDAPSEADAVVPSDPDLFTVTPVGNESWTTEAGTMHSMQYQYFPHATGAVAPPLPGITRTGVARSRIAAPA